MSHDPNIKGGSDPIPQANAVHVGAAGDPHGQEAEFLNAPWCCGVDFGQSRDPSAIAHVRKLGPDRFEVMHLEKVALGTPYPQVITRVQIAHRKLFWVEGELVVDASGVGRAPTDELRARGVKTIGVTITGGMSQTKVRDLGKHGEDWNVARTILTHKISSLVFSGGLVLPRGLPLLSAFVQELQDLRVSYSSSGAERVEVDPKADHHADLAFAVALAIWRLARPVRRVEFGRIDLMTR